LLHVPNPNDGAEDDLEKAFDMLLCISADELEAEAYSNYLRARSLNVLRLHWGAAREVAKALLRDRQLRPPALTQLIEEHLFEPLED
jgi:hypothetical protein